MYNRLHFKKRRDALDEITCKDENTRVWDGPVMKSTVDEKWEDQNLQLDIYVALIPGHTDIAIVAW